MAWPEARVLVASEVAPSLKVTVPLGVPLAGGTALTVAVKATDCPNTDGLVPETSAVVVLILLTIWLKIEEVLERKLPSPL